MTEFEMRDWGRQRPLFLSQQQNRVMMQQQRQGRVTALVRFDQLAYVNLWQDPAVVNDVLEALISPMMQPTDPQLAPLYEFLATHCYRETNWETVTSPLMWFGGEATRTEYTIFALCPGKLSEHVCVTERLEAPNAEKVQGG